MITDDKMREIAKALEGTTDSLDDLLEEAGITWEKVTLDKLMLLDSIVLCCEMCGQWCPTKEVNDECICEDCA